MAKKKKKKKKVKNIEAKKIIRKKEEFEVSFLISKILLIFVYRMKSKKMKRFTVTHVSISM